MGQAKRMFIWRLTRNMSRGDLKDLSRKIKRRDQSYICHKCGKNCGNGGLLAMHMKSPGRPYRAAHRKFDKELKCQQKKK